MKSALLMAALVLAPLAAPAPCRADESKQPAAPAVEPAKKGGPDAQKPSMEAMSAEFMRKVMETSARIEGMRKEIAEREQVLYETNQEIKTLRSQMMEIQKTINGILDEDKDLAALQMERDMLWTIMPVLPKSAAPRPMLLAPPTKNK